MFTCYLIQWCRIVFGNDHGRHSKGLGRTQACAKIVWICDAIEHKYQRILIPSKQWAKHFQVPSHVGGTWPIHLGDLPHLRAGTHQRPVWPLREPRCLWPVPRSSRPAIVPHAHRCGSKSETRPVRTSARTGSHRKQPTAVPPDSPCGRRRALIVGLSSAYWTFRSWHLFVPYLEYCRPLNANAPSSFARVQSRHLQSQSRFGVIQDPHARPSL